MPMTEQLKTAPAGHPSNAAPASLPHRRGRGSRWVLAGLAIAVVAAGIVWLRMPGAPAVHYVTAPASRGVVARTVTATGTVNPELTIIVGS